MLQISCLPFQSPNLLFEGGQLILVVGGVRGLLNYHGLRRRVLRLDRLGHWASMLGLKGSQPITVNPQPVCFGAVPIDFDSERFDFGYPVGILRVELVVVLLGYGGRTQKM